MTSLFSRWDYLPKSLILIGFSSVAILSVNPSSLALCSIMMIYFCKSWIFISAALDCFMISPSEISIFERSSKVNPEIKVVLLYEPLPSLYVPPNSYLLFDLYGVLLPLLLLETLDFDLLIWLNDLIVCNSFSKFIYILSVNLFIKLLFKSFN